MKKLLLSLVVISLIGSACGPSEKERAAEQAANEELVNEKVNEIMESMESAMTEATADSIDTDSSAAE